MAMTRSKTQVLYNYLPGQVFRHEDGYIATVFQVRTRRSDVPERRVLEALSHELEKWDHKLGFTDPRRGRDKYDIVEPVDNLVADLWPLTLECSRRNCRKVARFNRLDDFLASPNAGRCDRELADGSRCGGRLQQLEFLMAHHCGDVKQLNIRPCPTHEYKWLQLDDTGSFGTAELRCYAPGCNGTPVSRLGFRRCGCQMSARLPEAQKYMKALTVRAPNRFQTQNFSFVSLQGDRVDQLRTSDGGNMVAIGSYLGLFADVEAGLEDAKAQAKGDAEEWARVEKALRDAHMPEDIIQRQRAATLGEAQGKFAELEAVLPAEVITRLGQRQKVAERALIFGKSSDLVVERLSDYKQRAAQLNQSAAVERFEQSEHVLRDHSISDLLVVTNFPIALVAYGYTRMSIKPAEKTTMLRAFPPTRQGSAKKPLFVASSQTEGVFLELDALKVRDWLVSNDFWTDQALALGDDTRAVKARLMAEADAGTEAYGAVKLLCHTISHSLIRNLGERAGFGEETMAEYLIPEALTIGLYANVHQEFTLGALVSLVEHHLRSWLQASREGAEACAWDPICGDSEGACANCLHLAFGCEHRNHDLDRAVLFGSTSQDRAPYIKTGFWQY